jgi:two-component system phosphate regulon sensor histidine kinase PhoR
MIPDSVAVADASGRIVYLNEAWRQLMGAADQAEAIHMGNREFARDVHHTRVDGSPVNQDDFAITRALRGEVVKDVEIILNYGNGKVVWVQTSASPLRNPDGKLIGAVDSSHDVTRMRTLEREHQRERILSERRAHELEAVITSMADAVIITDSNGRTILANPMYTSLLGPSEPGESTGERFKRLNVRKWDGTVLEVTDGVVARALRGERVSSLEAIMAGPRGQDIYVMESGGPLVDSTGEVLGSVLVIRDVTSLYLADREKDDFLSLVAHELRTPITVIRGFTQVLRRSLQETATRETQHRLDIIDRQSAQLAALINELLDMSRLETGHFELRPRTMNYRHLIDTVVEDIMALDPHRNVVVHGPRDLTITGDSERLRQVLINLIDNAIQHGPEDTEVRVVLRVENNFVTTTVSDEGPGVPPSERERVFERFYRSASDTSGRGIGLGLYISRRIVEAHGGRIWVAEDVPSTFAFTLPEAQSKPELTERP